MKKSLIRLLLVVATLLVFTVPSYAQTASECYTCGGSYIGDDIYLLGCTYPANNSWGKEHCNMTWISDQVVICKTSGSMCYYFDVIG